MGHMILRRPLVRTFAVVVGVGLAVSGLGACSGGSDDPSGDTSASPSASAEPNYLEVPEGVQLTARGSEMEVGQVATVAWQPAADQVGALELSVTDVQKASIKVFSAWQLDAKTKKSQPYFVWAKATNVGAKPLDQVPLPLYAVDGKDQYITASSFDTDFKPCPSVGLPKKFKPGSSTKLCWVYLAPDHGKLTGVSFYPGPWFDPIIWRGDVTTYQPAKGKG